MSFSLSYMESTIMTNRNQLLCKSLKQQGTLQYAVRRLSTLIPDFLFLSQLEYEEIGKWLINPKPEYGIKTGTYIIARWYSGGNPDNIQPQDFEIIASTINDVHALDILRYNIHDPDPCMLGYTYGIFTLGYSADFSIATHLNDIKDVSPND